MPERFNVPPGVVFKVSSNLPFSSGACEKAATEKRRAELSRISFMIKVF